MSALVGLYFLFALLLTFYGINCHVMIHLFKRRYKTAKRENQTLLSDFYDGNLPLTSNAAFVDRLPAVTTQLPIYNELNVAERLIDAVAAITYPWHKHQIQVIDDSTDATVGIIARKVEALRQKGVRISHVRRENRHGFKAGALRHGLLTATGDLVVIFDADFLPPPDFLLKSVPYFVIDRHLGFVQGRWGHLNRNENVITHLQSIGINGHFLVEQSARNSNGLFMNFNGTAGVFRKQAIFDAGNWQDDTLTEDMDLSYRIQLKGWRCRYLPDLVVPAEIPSNINAFKSQQFRWAKGSIQTAIKLLPRICRYRTGWFTKIQAGMHLTHYVIHPLMLFLSILAMPVLISGNATLPTAFFVAFGVLLAVSCTGPSRLYVVAEHALKNSAGKTLLIMPLMICFGCGLAVNNTKAVMEAVFGKSSQFVRTPKRGFSGTQTYAPTKTDLHIYEILLGLWCLAGTFVYFTARHYIVGHFLLLYAIGYLLIGILSWRHGRQGT